MGNIIGNIHLGLPLRALGVALRVLAQESEEQAALVMVLRRASLAIALPIALHLRPLSGNRALLMKSHCCFMGGSRQGYMYRERDR